MKMRTFIRRRFVTGFHRGQKGFTLIELLIVVIILGILAGVLVPRLMSMVGSGHVAAANNEVANVESAAQAYYADNNAYPTDTNLAVNLSLVDPPGTTTSYVSHPAKYFNYTFDTDGKAVVGADGTLSITGGLKWDLANHKWVKA